MDPALHVVSLNRLPQKGEKLQRDKARATVVERPAGKNKGARYLRVMIPIDEKGMMKNPSVKRYAQGKQKTAPLIMKSGGAVIPVLLTPAQTKKVKKWVKSGTKRAQLPLTAAQLNAMLRSKKGGAVCDTVGEGVFKDIATIFQNVARNLLPGGLVKQFDEPLTDLIDKTDKAIIKGVAKTQKNKKKKKGGAGFDLEDYGDDCSSDFEDQVGSVVSEQERRIQYLYKHLGLMYPPKKN